MNTLLAIVFGLMISATMTMGVGMTFQKINKDLFGQVNAAFDSVHIGR